MQFLDVHVFSTYRNIFGCVLLCDDPHTCRFFFRVDVFHKFFEHINSNLWLCVRNENTRAISFYEKVGFEKDGDIAWKSGELPGTVFCKRKVDLFG